MRCCRCCRPGKHCSRRRARCPNASRWKRYTEWKPATWCKDDGVSRGRSRGPVPLKQTLGAVADDLRTASPDALATLRRRWPDVVGPGLAEHARPGGLVDGTLTVLVDDSTVGSMLQQQRGTLARRWSELLGEGVVRALRVVVEHRRERPSN